MSCLSVCFVWISNLKTKGVKNKKKIGLNVAWIRKNQCANVLFPVLVGYL